MKVENPASEGVCVYIDTDDDSVECPYCETRQTYTTGQYMRNQPAARHVCVTCSCAFTVERVYSG